MFKTKNSTTYSILVFILFIFISKNYFNFNLIEIAYAQGANPTQSFFNTMTQFISLILTFLHFITFIFFKILAYLLDPKTFLAINDTGLLLRLWQFSRDIMNVIFVFMLLGGSIAALVTAKGDLLKEHAPKFILAVILVNFSWFFPRVILDASSVLTATMYNITDAVAGECKTRNDTTGALEDCKAIMDIAFFNDPTAADPNGGWEEQLSGLLWVKYTNINNVQAQPSLYILNGLVVNHSKLRLIPFLRDDFQAAEAADPENFQGLMEIIKLLIRATLVLVIQIAICFPLTAMCVAFLIRIPILWLTISFMPFIFLGFALNGKFNTSITTEYIWKNFIMSAFLPFLVAIPLCIGYILITAGINSPPPSDLQELANIHIPLIQGISDFWALLWLFLSLMIIWVGVFKAIQSAGPAYEGMANSIKGFGMGVGKFALSLPASAPILPVGTFDKFDGKKDGRTSIKDMMQMAGNIDKLSGGQFGWGNESDGGGANQEFFRQGSTNQQNARNSFNEINNLFRRGIKVTDPQMRDQLKSLERAIRSESGKGSNTRLTIDDIRGANISSGSSKLKDEELKKILDEINKPGT